MNTQPLGAFGASMISLSLMSAAHAVPLPLESRLGGLAYYDPNLDITWLADANAGAGSTFDDASFPDDGDMRWASANSWAAGLTIGGISGWRLPSADVNGDGVVVDCTGGGVAGCADNEMGYLYWEEGITGAAPTPFSNVQTTNVDGDLDAYWSGTEFAPDPDLAWLFFFDPGTQDVDDKTEHSSFAWAVHSGDVFAGAVPEPPMMWLFAMGLIGLLRLGRVYDHSRKTLSKS